MERSNSTDEDDDDCAFRSDENAIPNATSYEADESPDGTPDDLDLGINTSFHKCTAKALITNIIIMWRF